MDDSGQISATSFLLDPDKPHDFRSGRPVPTEVTRLSESTLHFLVRLNDKQADDFIIALDGPLKGKCVNATLRDTVGKTSPIGLTFVRQN